MGHPTVAHALPPLLTAATVAAAVYVHHARWYWKPGFLALALLGSALTCYGTIGRQAGANDQREGDAMAKNRALEERLAALKEARDGAKAECVKIGPRCAQWQGRVDTLSLKTASMSAVSLDPRSDAIVKLAKLAGRDGESVKVFVTAVDPLALPLFLELGSIIFFASAFGKRQRLPMLAPESSETVNTYTRTRSGLARLPLAP